MHLLTFNVIFLCFSILSFSSLASMKSKLQYAGEIGVISLGVGYQVNRRYDFSLMYGVVPEEFNTNKVETYTFKNQLNLFILETPQINVITYSGVAIYYVTGKGINSGQAEVYPTGYYRLTSVRGLLFLGSELRFLQQLGMYFESGINDVWLVNYWNNREQINMTNYISLALGWNYYL